MKNINNVLTQLSKFLVLLFTFLIVSICAASESPQGKRFLVPIGVDGITIFVPIVSSPSDFSVSASTVAGSSIYNLSWSPVTNASYYQIIVTHEDGTVSITETTDLSHVLASLPLGRNSVSLAACDLVNRCGVPVTVGNYEVNERVRYVHLDLFGSPIMETDSAGMEISKAHYEPFGRSLEEQSEDIGYSGHLKDNDLGLSYMQARYYDPNIGRFYSVDPVDYTPQNPIHSFNRFAYANNNPYKYTDPDGNLPILLLVVYAYTAFEIGSTAYDVYDTATTLADPNASNVEKGISVGGLAAGIYLPGPGTLYKHTAKMAEAQAARDTLAETASKLSNSKRPATVTAGYNIKTGEVTAKACGGGKCAEDHVVEALGGNKEDVRFTEAVRPRTGEQVPVCTRCEENYGRESFPSETTRFKSDELE